MPLYTVTRTSTALSTSNDLLTIIASSTKPLRVYIADMKLKGEMNRAWDEWVDRKNPPMRACLGVELEPPHIVEIVVTAAK